MSHETANGHMITQEQLWIHLDAFRVQLLSEEREDAAAAIEDLMDFVVGWCSPHRRWFPVNSLWQAPAKAEGP